MVDKKIDDLNHSLHSLNDPYTPVDVEDVIQKLEPQPPTPRKEDLVKK